MKTTKTKKTTTTTTKTKIVTKLKNLIVGYTHLPLAEREALFLEEYAKLTQKYSIGVAVATVDLTKRDLPIVKPRDLPTIEA